MLYLLILLGFLFFAAVAMCVNEGLWNNTISLLCLLISSLAGALAGVPFGAMVLEKADRPDEHAWYFVFVGMWGVFSLTLLLLRILSEKASGFRVRFLPLVDKMGGILMGLVVAVMLTSFAAFTLMYGPVKAGQSKWNEASKSRVQNLEKVVSPFYTVLKRFSESEKMELPLD